MGPGRYDYSRCPPVWNIQGFSTANFLPAFLATKPSVYMSTLLTYKRLFRRLIDVHLFVDCRHFGHTSCGSGRGLYSEELMEWGNMYSNSTASPVVRPTSGIPRCLLVTDRARSLGCGVLWGLRRKHYDLGPINLGEGGSMGIRLITGSSSRLLARSATGG